MTCHDTREWFSAWLDEALGAEERARVDAHLLACAECRRELDRLQRTVGLLRAVEPVRAPVGFVDHVLESARPEPWFRRLLRRLFRPLRVKLPIEAAAVLLVGLTALYVYQQSPELQQAARPEAPVTPARPTTPSAPSEPAPSTKKVEPAPAVPLERDSEARVAKRRDAAGKDTGAKESMEQASKAPDAPPPAAGASAGGESEASRAAPPGEPARTADTERAESAWATGAQSEAREKQARPLTAPPPAVSAPAAPAPAPAREPRRDAPEEKAGSSLAPSVHRFSARALVSVDVAGRLVVKDREAASQGLTQLVARLGGTQLARRPDPGAPDVELIEIVVPRPAYAEFIAELGRLGQWLPEREVFESPDYVRVVLRLGD